MRRCSPANGWPSLTFLSSCGVRQRRARVTVKGLDPAAAVCGILGWRSLQGTIATYPPARGVPSVSDRMDIARLIDSKVTATQRTVARSKQLADAAKDDLTTHEEWFERHCRRAQEDSERYQRRLGRRRRVEGCKRFALWLLLLGLQPAPRHFERLAAASQPLAKRSISAVAGSAQRLMRYAAGSFASLAAVSPWLRRRFSRSHGGWPPRFGSSPSGLPLAQDAPRSRR